MKINTKAFEKQWFKYDDTATEFLIRAFPTSLLKWDEKAVMSVLYEQFDYCLIDWKGVEDQDGNNYPFTPENKKNVFDFSEPIREFVFAKARELAEAVHGELKN